MRVRGNCLRSNIREWWGNFFPNNRLHPVQKLKARIPKPKSGSLTPGYCRWVCLGATASQALTAYTEHDRSIPALLKNAVDWGGSPLWKEFLGWQTRFHHWYLTGRNRHRALAQQHLRSIMVELGMILLGGEAYVTFKPNLVDEDGNIADESTRKFLQGFLDRFVSLVVRLSQPDPHSAGQDRTGNIRGPRRARNPARA